MSIYDEDDLWGDLEFRVPVSALGKGVHEIIEDTKGWSPSQFMDYEPSMVKVINRESGSSAEFLLPGDDVPEMHADGKDAKEALSKLEKMSLSTSWHLSIEYGNGEGRES